MLEAPNPILDNSKLMQKLLFLSFLLVPLLLAAPNGKIVDRQIVDLKSLPELQNKLFDSSGSQQVLREKYRYLDSITAERITYLSDGLKVKGYLVYPKAPGKYPGIVYNRGGNKEFGKITSFKVAFIMGRVAARGYVVAGSQYRGNDGGEGHEEFGGKDVDDVINMVPLLKSLSDVDSSRLGIFGWSRGGMMTYLTLMRTGIFRAAVVGGGLSDLFLMMNSRPDMEEVYYDVIPGYAQHKEASLDVRSAIRHVDKICKTTPILMLHGTADWRCVPQMALDMAAAFQKERVPYRLVMLEGGDHGLTEHNDEVYRQIRMWLDRFVKGDASLPDLQPHGK